MPTSATPGPGSPAAAPSSVSYDHDEVRTILDMFFSAFVSGPRAHECGQVLREVMLPTAVVVRTCGGEPMSYTVEEFIAPRIELLTSGAVEDFREWVTDVRVDLFGDIAQAWCGYDKSWRQATEDHHGRGMKSIQLVRNGRGWRISAVAWDDERPGPAAPAGVQPPGQ